MRAISISKSLAAASANNIALTQTRAAGQFATINGATAIAAPLGPFAATVTAAILDTQRRVIITSAANDSANTAVITGLNGTGGQIREILPLTAIGVAQSALDYKTILSVQFPTGTAGAITIGTSNVGSTDWFVPNYHMAPFSMQFATEANGAVTWNLETTNDPNFFDPPKSPNVANPIVNVATLVPAGTIAQVIPLTVPVTGWRFTITAGAGVLSAQAQQAGITNM